MINTNRPGWDEYFLDLADAVSARADCTRSKVGAVLVSEDHKVISVGYNGAPSRAPGCLTDNACPRGRLSYEELPELADYSNCIAIHAEANAIKYAYYTKAGYTLYVTRSPCRDCQREALHYGVYEIVWRTPDLNIAKMQLFP